MNLGILIQNTLEAENKVGMRKRELEYFYDVLNDNCKLEIYNFSIIKNGFMQNKLGIHHKKSEKYRYQDRR